MPEPAPPVNSDVDNECWRKLMSWVERILNKPAGIFVAAAAIWASEVKAPYVFRPSGLHGAISDINVLPVGDTRPLPAGFTSADVDLGLMAAWSLRCLRKDPRPSLDYEPVFFVRPMHVPPAPDGHDPIVPGDTDARMDWEFPNMREILGLKEAGPVEKGLHRRVIGYLHDDGLAWVPPGHFMEGEVYKGKRVGPEKIASTWATCKILRSLAEEYKRTRDDRTRSQARQIFVALRKLADWDAGRAYYPHGSGAWADGKWIKSQSPTALLEPVVSYWEAYQDPEGLDFAKAVAEGLMADAELLPPQNARIQASGEFHGHMHSTLHGVWGVAHLGADLHDARYLDWARKVYDYASQFGPGTGWMQAALWSDAVRELSETCATSDMVSIASWLAKGGFAEYWDHVERALRNYIRPQQFFVTPQYEALYRKLNPGVPEEQIQAGLARMRDFQGSVMGGPAPNDWINWIGSDKQCGPYVTPYGCMSLFGCCTPEGMRALHTVWAGITTVTGTEILVNLSLSRKSQWADVISSAPQPGRIDVQPHTAGTYYLRPPSWSPRDGVHIWRKNREVTAVWGGPAMAYIVCKNVKPGETLTLVYPLVTFKQVWGNWPSKPNLKLTITWRGNSVTDMEPKGKGLPIDFANLPPLPPLVD
jgi:hypothetical protein